MSTHRTYWLSALAGLAVVVTLALVAHWARGRPAQGCALDGAKIDPVYRVEIVDGQGQGHDFCCLVCARLWLDRQTTRPQAIRVTDEASGETIDAATAFFVRSSVVTRPTTGNRVHVFRNRSDAEKHADLFGGFVLPEAEGPFQ